jgi:hypothetical protein
MESGNLNFLEPSGPLQAGNGADCFTFLHSSLYKLRTGATGFLLDSRTMRMRPLGCPETSVRNYHCLLRNDIEEGSSLNTVYRYKTGSRNKTKFIALLLYDTFITTTCFGPFQYCQD